MDAVRPVIVILGPTASGKSDLAIRLAKKFSGEIICADSRTVYKGMNIGTAKPSKKDRAEIKHHCLDLISPNERYSAASFKRTALKAIKEINNSGSTPFVVGGSGLYINGLIYDFEFISRTNDKRRLRLEKMELKELNDEAIKAGISSSDIDFKNKRHLARAVERGSVPKNRKNLAKNILLIGPAMDKSILHQRIEKRIEQMLEMGLVEEVKNLTEQYGETAPGLQAPGYKALIEYINGSINFEAAKEKFIKNDKNLAKRQVTWFRKDRNIHWINNYTEAEKLIADFLKKFDTIAM